jgi:hypothetical protein
MKKEAKVRGKEEEEARRKAEEEARRKETIKDMVARWSDERQRSKDVQTWRK